VILIDADVILDVALDRAPHAEASAQLLDLLELRHPRGFVAWHTLSNVYYMLRPAQGDGDARTFLSALTEFLLVSPTDTESFRVAATLPLSDLEDAMQVAAAMACGAQYIATRNVRDFSRSAVQARTPAQLIEELY
jgi:predicted nucleic acid-binding protein